MNSIFKMPLDKISYSELYGLDINIPLYRNITHVHAKIFFKLLDLYKLDYYVFAGTSIGYFRNKCNIPWVDDYDIIIFESSIQKFIYIIMPKLLEIGFTYEYKFLHSRTRPCGVKIFSYYGNKSFQCDIFYSKIINGVLKNIDNWGLYASKNVPINLVMPKKYYTIDGDLTLPFFNNIEKDIKLEYGDVINKIVINVDHRPTIHINSYFDNIYKMFNYSKEKIIYNNKKIFNNHNYLNNITLTEYVTFIRNINYIFSPYVKYKIKNIMNFLKYIKNNNIKTLNLTDEKFLEFCPDLKFYFKDIKINFYVLKPFFMKSVILFKYVDNIYCYSNAELNKIKAYLELLEIKTNIDIVRAITFGEYNNLDENNRSILRNGKQLGKLYVGVSINKKDYKNEDMALNKRKEIKDNIKKTGYADIIFDQDVDNKNEYIEKYDCNLLVTYNSKDKNNNYDLAYIIFDKNINEKNNPPEILNNNNNIRKYNILKNNLQFKYHTILNNRFSYLHFN